MSKIIDEKLWGALFKIFLASWAPVCISAISYFIWTTVSIYELREKIGDVNSWRKSHTEMSDTYIKKFERMESDSHKFEVEQAIMRESLKSVAANTDKTAAAIALMTEQGIRQQQLTAEIKEKIVNIQIRLDDAHK